MSGYPFIDPNNLSIETDDAGFVLGQSLLGTTLSSEGIQWRAVNADFTSLSITRSVQTQSGVLFRPEAANLTVVTRVEDYFSGVTGQRIRVKWNGAVIFLGEMQSATLQSDATITANEPDNTYMTIQAVGLVANLNDYVLTGYQRSQETVATRLTSSFIPAPYSITVNNCNRVLAARGVSNVKLFTVLAEATDAQIARVYVDCNNTLVVDGDPAPDPVITFGPESGQTGFRSVAWDQNTNNTITTVVAQAKQDNTIYAEASYPNAVILHQESYTVDLPTDQTEVSAWAQSFPLQGYAGVEPSSLDTFWQDELVNLELLHLVEIVWRGHTYQAGVSGISHSITPDPLTGGLVWNVSLSLMPAHLLEYSPVLAPSIPPAFTASPASDHSINLSWQAPSLPNQMNGYEIRMSQGTTPPQTLSDGSLVALPTVGETSYTVTGLDSSVTYSFSLWAVTSNAAVYSKMVTAQATTPETIPGAPQGLTAVKTNTTTHALSWTPPSAPGTNIASYELRYRTDGVNPTATTGSQFATINYGTNSYTAINLSRNITVHWGLFPKTQLGAYGPGAFATQNTNETVPGAVPNLTVTAPNYETLSASWGAASPLTDFDHYHVEDKVGSAPTTPGSGNLWVDTTTTSHSSGAAMNTNYYVSVWPVTKGGLYGARSSGNATTPQGIFSHTVDLHPSWSQSYRSTGAPSSLGSGDPRNLYYGNGDSYNMNQRSMAGFPVPSNVVNCYAIDKVTLTIYSLHTWNATATCYFGAHTATSQPGTFQQTWGSLFTATMPKPGWVTIDVTGSLGAHLKAGAKGITLGPAPSDSNGYYGYAAGTPGPVPTLHIEYRTIGG